MPYAPVSQNAGTTVIVADPSPYTIGGQEIELAIRPLSYTITAAGTATAQWQDTAGNALSGVMSMATGVPISANSADTEGLMQTAAGKGLQLVTTGAAVAGHVAYERTKAATG